MRKAAGLLLELTRQHLAPGVAADAFDAPVTGLILWSIGETVDFSPGEVAHKLSPN